jgi:competence protein ComEC
MLSTEQIETFRRAGAAHVIALSGMHLGIIALLLSRVIRPFAPARVGNGLLLASLVAYVWVAGWIASLVRALVLVLVAAGARARHRTVPGPVLLARAVLVCTVIVPGIGSDLGFQFSVAALGGLMILSGPMVSWFSRVMPRSVAQYAAPSAAAMVATAPIALAIFGVVYPVGVISAGVLGLLVMAVVIAAIALLLGAAIPIVGTALVWLVERLVSILTGSAALAARAPAWEPPLGLRDITLVVAIAAVCVAVAAGVWRVVLFRVRRRQREPQFYF